MRGRNPAAGDSTARVEASKVHPASEAASEGGTIRPLTGPEPYSVLDVDGLRDQLDALVGRRAALSLSLKSLDASIEAAIKARDGAAAELRRRRDQIGTVLQGESADESQAQLELATIQAQVAELEVIQGDDARRRTRERLEALGAPIDQLRSEIERAHTRQRLEEADLRKVLEGIGADRRRLAAAGTKLGARLARTDGDGGPVDAVRARENEVLSEARISWNGPQTS